MYIFLLSKLLECTTSCMTMRLSNASLAVNIIMVDGQKGFENASFPLGTKPTRVQRWLIGKLVNQYKVVISEKILELLDIYLYLAAQKLRNWYFRILRCRNPLLQSASKLMVIEFSLSRKKGRSNQHPLT